MFLTFEDCLGLCDLTEQEVLAIAEHEHVPAIAALELGNYLARTAEGEQCIKAMIRDDIARAAASGDRLRVLALKSIIRDYILKHPCCEARHRDALTPRERRDKVA
ncbi:MAG TPA: hypothetical protein VFJ70_16465 [Burkholderiales bacterium]|nr:hypothetical protein [Burkholderiales bacterium]